MDREIKSGSYVKITPEGVAWHNNLISQWGMPDGRVSIDAVYRVRALYPDKVELLDTKLSQNMGYFKREHLSLFLPEEY